jgi:hypothetical protein
VWARRSPLNLMGTHINVTSGIWTHRDAGIGAGADSFYEYLLKAGLLFADAEYLAMFGDAYAAIVQYTQRPPWYLDVDYERGQFTFPHFSSLQAFWPGLQVLHGDVLDAADTLLAFMGVWHEFGAVPEEFDLVHWRPYPRFEVRWRVASAGVSAAGGRRM